MNNLLLIDGSSMLSTSFYGNLNPLYLKTGDTSGLMKTSTGVFTNGVYTMSKVLLNLIDKQKPTHMAIMWDVSRNTFRREMYEQYKAHRSETKPELSSQFGLMQQVIEKMNLKQFKLAHAEADDLIGTFAKRFEDEVTVYIMTKDQDSLQLISENTRVWLVTSKSSDLYKGRGIDTKELSIPDGVFEYTVVTFEEEYGLKPIQMIDKKALEGDSSDNIPGVKGVGPAVVVPLLQEFGTVEALYETIENMTKEEEDQFRELLKNLGIKRSPLNFLLKESDEELVGKKAALMSKELATIKTDIAEFNHIQLDDLKVHLDRDGTKEIFTELEFKSLLKKL